MSDQELKVRISGEDNLSPSIKKATESLGDLNTRAVNLASGLTILEGVTDLARVAYEALEHQFEKAIEAAIANEQANNRLAGALVSTGQYSEATEKQIDEYAKSLEQTDGAQIATTKSLVGMSIQMGLTVPQAEKMEEAARKLAAATGKDVNSAFQMLQATLAGHSRGLAMVLPQIKELGTAQLQSGAAIDIVNQSLDAQYQLYKGSFAASLNIAKSSIEKVYEAFGEIIIQNPIVKEGIQLFSKAMFDLATKIEAAGEYIKEHQAQIEQLLVSFGKAIGVVGSVAAAMAVAAEGATALGAALAFITGPVGIAVAAAAALTAALYKWPGLFDVIVGSVKSFGVMLLQLVSGPMLIVMETAGKIAGIFDKQLGKSITDLSEGIHNQLNAWQQSSQAQVEYGVQSIKTGNEIKKAEDTHTEAVKQNLKAISDRNRILLDTQKVYAGYAIGTLKQRQALAGQVQDRDRDLNDFKKYQEDKNRLAINAALEQQTELAKFKQGQLKGTGGAEESKINAEVEIDTEKEKQATLDSERKRGLLSDSQYREALLSSQEKMETASLQSDQAYAKAKADALGESDEGFAQRLALQEAQADLQEKQLEDHLTAMHATAEEQQIAINEFESQAQQDELNKLDQHLNAIAQREEISGQTITATRQKYIRQQEKQQADNIKQFASGQTAMVAFQTAASNVSQKIANALVKNQKMSAKAMVGAFLESFGQQVIMKGMGDMVMGIFPPNPVQLAAGAAEVAIGTAIGRVGASMSGENAGGGQGDEGNDNIPQPLSGKSFIVSGGERIVQPSANKDLTAFLNSQKMNPSGGGGGNYNITLNYSGPSSKDDVQDMADMLIEEIRKRSERGTQIVNSKGVY